MLQALRSRDRIQTIAAARSVAYSALVSFVTLALCTLVLNAQPSKKTPKKIGLPSTTFVPPSPAATPKTPLSGPGQSGQSASSSELARSEAEFYRKIPDVLTNIERDMKKPALLDYVQIAAALSALIAFVVLVYQTYLLRVQTATLENSIKASTYQQIASTYIDINKALATDPQLAAAFDSFDTILPSDFTLDVVIERRRKWLGFWLINHYENAHVQFAIGGLPAQQWEAIAQDCIVHICRRPYLRRLFEESRGVFSRSFVVFVESNMPPPTENASAHEESVDS